MRWKPNVTVAAVIKKNKRFLMVEEETDNNIVINQPAGHLEKDESLLAAVQREVLEETAWEFEAEKITGVYLYPSPDNDISYFRICFSGRATHHRPEQSLDEGIIRAVWMTREELKAQSVKLRSPLVIRCIDDYLTGEQYPLELLRYIEDQ